jgi:transcriptional regulator with XRE-family HTH domain
VILSRRKKKALPPPAKTETPSGRGRPRNEKLNLDVTWMKARMQALRIKSWAELSRTIGMDKAMMSKSLNGERVFTAKDVVRLAEVLQVTADEILRRIGYEMSARGVMVVGKITNDARVSSVAAQKGQIRNVADAPPGAVALVAEGLVGYDDAAFVFVPAQPGRGPSLSSVGQLCIVEADAHITPYLGTLIKGGGKKLTLELFGIGTKIEIEQVHTAAPISAIHFG